MTLHKCGCAARQAGARVGSSVGSLGYCLRQYENADMVGTHSHGLIGASNDFHCLRSCGAIRRAASVYEPRVECEWYENGLARG